MVHECGLDASYGDGRAWSRPDFRGPSTGRRTKGASDSPMRPAFTVCEHPPKMYTQHKIQIYDYKEVLA